MFSVISTCFMPHRKFKCVYTSQRISTMSVGPRSTQGVVFPNASTTTVENHNLYSSSPERAAESLNFRAIQIKAEEHSIVPWPSRSFMKNGRSSLYFYRHFRIGETSTTIID